MCVDYTLNLKRAEVLFGEITQPHLQCELASTHYVSSITEYQILTSHFSPLLRLQTVFQEQCHF